MRRAAASDDSDPAHRLPTGGRIDRSRPLGFTFNGSALRDIPATRSPPRCSPTACTSSARSFKYHRPRGILTAGVRGAECAGRSSRTRRRTEPNIRATAVELYEGLVATSQNRWPSLSIRHRRVNDLFAASFPAGFYYKTFMWPPSVWTELRACDPPRGRARQGARASPIPIATSKSYAHCDVLVVGGGPAGPRRGARRRRCGRAGDAGRRAGRARRLAAVERASDRRQAGVRMGGRAVGRACRACPR